MAKITIPTHDALMNPLIQAIKSLGGSGTIEEINTKVAEIIGFSDEQLTVLIKRIASQAAHVKGYHNGSL